jgi:2-oxoisovalerate dehydrogenase E1 component alpha subunit
VDASSEPLSLRIPAPLARPGQTAEFGDLQLSPAGSVRRPSPDAAEIEMLDLAYELVRVLDDDGHACGPWAESLDEATLRVGLRDMLTVRTFDRTMLRAQRQGKTSFYVQALGEEAVACAHRRALRPGDMCFPTYRQQGALIAADYPLVAMANQIFSNSHDPIRGRQLPVMYSAKAYGFFSISGNLGTQFIQAVGWAMASALAGDTKIASAWIGDGATAESDFHSAMVFASTYQAPVVLNIVNNQWAISTFQGFARGSGATFAARGHGFGIPALRVDGNDWLAVRAATTWAAERARRNLGPTLIEWVTYRVGAHSSSDDPKAYRPDDEAARWPLGDPIERLDHHMRTLGTWNAASFADLEAEVESEVAAAVAEAEAFGTLAGGGPPNSPSSMFDDVFAAPTPELLRQRQQSGY